MAFPCFSAEVEQRPELEVSGYGLFGNRKLKRTIQLLETTGQRPRFYEANFIEDAILIVRSQLMRDGFLQPVISAEIVLDDGKTMNLIWDEPIEEPLPRPLRARRLHLKIQEGVLFHFRNLTFNGLEAVSANEARSYFVETGALLPLKRTRIYTDSKLQRGLRSLVEAHARQGFEGARAETNHVHIDAATGAVDVSIQVSEGLKSIVRTVRRDVFIEQTNQVTQTSVLHPDEPYSRLWRQDFIQRSNNTNYHLGYPDARTELSVLNRETEADRILLDMQARVFTGPKITLRDVRFEGAERTRQSVLHRRVRLSEGRPLDRLRAEQGRYRLARLGIFDSVEVDYEPVDEHTRDVVYRLKEGKQIDVSLLAGYGSYELLRGGFEVEQFNVFGRGHNARLRAIQSFKASSADYIYTMPELLGENIDVFLNASGLRRQEIEFTREEFGGGIGARKYFRPISSDVSVRYNYQVLHAAETDLELTDLAQSAGVGALVTDLKHDRRDNPLYPRQGYKIFSTLELASELLGGEVNYERLEIAVSWHRPLDEGRWIHFGLGHGMVLTSGDSSTDLPFNRRFFPGGENSIRGYQQGEAAPRDDRGRIVGAETYLSGNFEFEQSLTSAWSVIAFFDALGIGLEARDLPTEKGLFSVGAGLRWKTIVGPVRLEYGHNLNPREHDPSGTLHFSIGFPF